MEVDILKIWDWFLLQKIRKFSQTKEDVSSGTVFFWHLFNSFQGWSVQKVAPRKATQRRGTREDRDWFLQYLDGPRYAPLAFEKASCEGKACLIKAERLKVACCLWAAYTLQDSRQVWQRICMCLSHQVVGVLCSISSNRFLHNDDLTIPESYNFAVCHSLAVP